MTFWNDLPPALRAILAVLTGATILGGLAVIDYRLAAIIAAGLLLLALVVAGFFVVRGWMQRRQAKSMTGELSQHSSAAPQGVSDVARRAKLDDLRQKFAAGVSKFGNAENIYRFPWYLIVGEPGGGKSEAIRHSNVGFPSGMQDELQGVGGTINMNWWFTNHAVFLDTAGRLMFEEVKPGETNEWREFLLLLARNRPNCPINGLMLVIPADSLIRDSDRDIEAKAGRIAQQFDTIQRALDIRFPVFVLITKCDLMAGFREFFDDFTDAQSQSQMIGWSNPLDRDAPFQPGMVTEHIETVVQRVKKRRLSLLRDPVPQKGQERRVDEVDALYSFPHSLSLIAPRLRLYMEKVFVAGPWSPKPLFLRGIYFASSMREGAALDQELAQALGLPPDQLGENRSWERERAYFLRDLFTEKMFKEAGLVTRASNTSKMLRTRSLLLWGSGTVLVLLFIGLSILGYQGFRSSIQAHSRLWAAAKVDWKPGIWHPIVAPNVAGETHAEYKGGETVVSGGGAPLSLVDYQDKLRQLAPQKIETSWVYRPMLKLVRLDNERRHAQRIVLDASVISPVLKEARHRMELEKPEEAPDSKEPNSARLLREAEAIAALVRVETEALAQDHNMEAVPPGIFDPLLQYSTARQNPAGDKRTLLDDAVVQTYTNNPLASWPPPWLALGSTTLAANKPIENGLRRLRTFAGLSVKNQVESVDRLKSLRDDLRAFRDRERQMDATVPLTTPPAEKVQKLNALMTELGGLKKSIDEKVKAAREQGLFSGDTLALRTAYERLVSDSESQAAQAFKVVKAAVKPQLADPGHRLFKEVDDLLDQTLAGIKQDVAQGFTAQELTEAEGLDPLLADFGDGHRFYEVRWAQYEASQREASQTDPMNQVLGQNWTMFAEVKRKLDVQRGQVEALAPKLTPPFVATCKYYLDRAQEIRLNAIVAAYRNQSASLFDSSFNYPLVSGGRGNKGMSGAEMQKAEGYLGMWQRELGSETFKTVQSPHRAALEAFGAELKKIDVPKNLQAMSSSITVTVLGWDKGGNKTSLALWRGVRLGGSLHDIGAGASPSVKIPFGGTFTATFVDYPTTVTKSETVSASAERLLEAARSSGGGTSINVAGSPMALSVQGDGPDPKSIPRPDKNHILATLR